MGKASVWVLFAFVVLAAAGRALMACGSDATGSSNAAITTCDAGADACPATAPAQGGW